MKMIRAQRLAWRRRKEAVLSYAIHLPLAMAILVTAIFLSVVYWASGISYGLNEGSISRWEKFLTLPPNEVGDTLSGLVGSLTLVWIIASVWQQNIELRAQRKELNAMANAMKSQATSMEFEMDRARELDADKVLLEALGHLRIQLLENKFPERFWEFHDVYGERQKIELTWNPVFYYGRASGLDFEEFFSQLSNDLHLVVAKTKRPSQLWTLFKHNGHIEDDKKVLSLLNIIPYLMKQCTEAQKWRVERMKLDRIRADFSEIFEFHQQSGINDDVKATP